MSTKISLVSGSHLVFIGKIRDPLHDTIPITSAEKHVIDSPEFQRLRRIQQTAFIRYVFPGATHTRFEHSLGVMHMSGIMAVSLVANQRRLLTELSHSVGRLAKPVAEDFARREGHEGSLRATEKALELLESDPRLLQCLRFAALLHDVGHAPFSHSGERFLPTWTELKRDLKNLKISSYLKEGLQKKCDYMLRTNPRLQDTPIRHEIYTLMIVDRIFQAKDNEDLSAQMGQDVCSVIDCSIDPTPGGVLARSGLQSLLHEVVSGELDVDRMDYLMRDSRQCGVVYGLFDAARILDSACFYYDAHDSKFHLSMRKRGVPALEDYLRARWSMYQQVYFHKTATACEAMLESVRRSLSQFRFPLDVSEYLKLDDSSFYDYASRQAGDKKDFALRLLRDLIYDRRLWKRVYEENSPRNAAAMPSLCPTVQMFLRKNKIPSEMIENSTSLTRFAPKGREVRSQNSLKVVVKDVHGLRFLEPIEHHSPLVNRTDEETTIRRIFVSLYKETGESIETGSVQTLLSQGVLTPTMEEV